MKCSATIYNYSSDSIEWFKDTLTGEKKLETDNFRYRIDLEKSKFSSTKKLRLLNVTLNDKGRYICRVGENQNIENQNQRQYQVSASRRQSIRYPSHRNDDPTLNNENQLSFKLNVLPLEHPAFINR